MGASLSVSHMIVIDNKTNFPLKIRKCTDLDPKGRPILIVEPHKIKAISSKKIFKNWSDSSSPRTIKFYLHGKLFNFLSPKKFSSNESFTVEMNDQNILSVTAVPYKKTPPNRHSAVPSISDSTEEPLLLSRGSCLKCWRGW